MASLEDVKARLYISIAMLAVDTVELGLQRQAGGLFPIEGILLPVSHVRDNTCRVQHAEQQTSVDHGT
jgi:hypothetical protein